MLKTICVCNRCGKTFDEQQSKTILFVPARKEREKLKNGSQENGGLFFGLFRSIYREQAKDYCPECVDKIHKFIQGDETIIREDEGK